ncbi:response regulator [Lutibacter sp.]|uniref:response regulator n=1 Tax=Lutibacter sp. TaxID=1925666 RepID=UPI001A1C0F48|nr:response regulator [Lutibacter sp.]MBI9041937.1 response regulator [Lutibacter sp.]
MKILYVEDNSIDVDLTQRTIQKAFPTCILHTARTIAEAQKALKKVNDYNLLLLDLHLPDGNGMDLLFEIRKKNISIAIIILTGSNDEEIAITALKTGADDYLSKSAGYLNKLPEAIHHTLKNFNGYHKNESETIHVLYAEWHEADIEFTTRHFKKFAPYIKLNSVSNAQDALKLLPKTTKTNAKFDILLLDYQLSGINAIEVIKIIRQERKLTIPIVIVTGQGNEEIAVQALKLGADEYLVKRENYLVRLPSILLSVYQKTQLKIKQQEILKSKEEYKSFFEDDLTGDFISTIDGKLLNCNPAYLKICGFSSKEEALKFDTRKLYANPASRTQIIELLKKERNLVSYEAELIRIDGNKVQVIGNMVGGFDEKDNLITLKGYIFDDTERKLAVEELRKISKAVEQSPSTVLITDIDGNIEYVNKTFIEISGYTLNEVKGKNPRIFNSGNQPKEVYQQLWKTIKNGGVWFGEFLNKKKDGSLFWEQASISSIKDKNGDITNFIAIKEDITDKKNNEIKLMNALEKAQESDRLKSAFLANLSHEIRTPMNGILGFSDLLKSPNLSGEKQQKYISIIEKSGIRMLNTINDIISISKIESGQISITLKEFNINNQLKELYNFLRIEAEKKGISLSISNFIAEQHATIKSDSEKTYAILLNLIKNAIKFTHNGKVEFGCILKENQLEFYVSDTGIGIPVERQRFVFDRFVQADIEDKELYGGSGLGLAISKSYVEMLGGKIWLISTEGVGSKFNFTLPYHEIKKENSHTELIDENIENKKLALTILIVEDDFATQLYLKEILNPLSKKIILANNGLEGLELFNKNLDIDLILMDIQIPDMNGYKVTSEIRQINKEIIIIAQTAYALSGDREKALSAGCNEYLSKPIKQSELFRLIFNYFS